MVLELALKVAKLRGRLPLPVLFLDQEFEWQSTIDQIEATMKRPEIKPYWVQLPFVMNNSASLGNTKTTWLKIWERGKSDDYYIRPKNPLAIHDVDCPDLHTDETRYHDMFPVLAEYFFGANTAYLAGMRAEENPTRAMAVTSSVKYKDITWANGINPKRNTYTFYPIYDWSYEDVWHCIYEGGYRYSSRYDLMDKMGIAKGNMRVSALIHETAVTSLYELQEAEPEIYDRVVQRVAGAETVAEFGAENFMPDQLPIEFNSWKEYAMYLYDYLVDDEYFIKNWETALKRIKPFVDNFPELAEGNKGLWWEMAKAVAGNDGDMTRIYNRLSVPEMIPYKKALKKIKEAENAKKTS